MHTFESQLISTVKATEADDKHVTFVGHYRHGDGASLPAIGAGIAAAFFAIYFALGGFILLPAIALCLLVPSIAGFTYQKTILFDLESRKVIIKTRTVWDQKEERFPVDDLQLKAKKINIRLAENCGALDLLLPGETIRLIVDGKFEWTLEKAQRLSTQTGIQLLTHPNDSPV